MRRKDTNPLKRIEGEKISVTRNDMSGLAAYRKFKNFVILRVATSRDLHIHINPLRFFRKGRQKITNVFFIHVPTEPLSVQNFVEFSERCEGKQYLAFSQRQIKGLTRLRFRQEERANENVGIEDAAQLCPFEERIQHLRSEPPRLGLSPRGIEHFL